MKKISLDRNLVQLVSIIGLFFIGIFSRLLPHPSNVTPVLALCAWSFCFFRKVDSENVNTKVLAMIVPLGFMIVSDYFIKFHPTMLWVYGSLMIIIGLGIVFRPNKSLFHSLGLGAFISTLFFVITNFGIWAQGSLYPQTVEGLKNCFTMAIPFWGQQLSSDLFFMVVLWCVYQLFQVVFAKASKVTSIEAR